MGGSLNPLKCSSTILAHKIAPEQEINLALNKQFRNFVGESLGQTEVKVYYSLPENKYVNQPGFQLNLTFSGDKLNLKVFREANGIFSFPPAFSSKESNDFHLGKLGRIIMNDLLPEAQCWQILTRSELFNSFCRNHHS